MGERCAVIVGLGTMGCDIAAIFLAHGWRVCAIESKRSEWEPRRAATGRSVAQLGTVVAGRLVIHEAPGEVRWNGVELVIETVPEELALKQQIFSELDRLVPASIPVASNSSALRITDIAARLPSRSRMAGVHFFMPAHLVPAVEVIDGEFTDPEVCERLAALMKTLGRVPIRVRKDIPGFVANRLQHALMREAFAFLDAGLAPIRRRPYRVRKPK